MNTIIDILNSVVKKHTITESDNNIESSSTESVPEKALVLSQFTKVLDLLESILNSNGIQFRRFDGKVKDKSRDKAVTDF
jgi:SNF2 family DNA or RNA helicase